MRMFTKLQEGDNENVDDDHKYAENGDKEDVDNVQEGGNEDVEDGPGLAVPWAAYELQVEGQEVYGGVRVLRHSISNIDQD